MTGPGPGVPPQRMRFNSLGSGSEGNALLVECGSPDARVRLLIDCGFGVREAGRRLGRLGLGAGDLHAVLVTHEHGDHIGAAPRLAATYGIPLHLTYGTAQAGRSAMRAAAQVCWIDPHRPFEVAGVRIEPVAVPHDAREPVQFVFSDGSRRLGVATDLGSSTPHVESMLSACDALVLECNHDREMLSGGGYPPHLKRRIAGRFGHLDNGSTATLLGALDNSRLQHLVAAHLSQQNNTPALARAALSQALGCAEHWIGVADQDEGFAWRSVI